MGIKIGDKNKISNSIISDTSSVNIDQKKKGWVDKHPVITAITISIVTGILLMFSFWDNIISGIESWWGR